MAMLLMTTYRGFDLSRGDDLTTWSVRRDGKLLETFNSEDDALGFCDRLKKQEREQAQS